MAEESKKPEAKPESPEQQTSDVAAQKHQDPQPNDQYGGEKERVTPQEMAEESKASPVMQESSGPKQENQNPDAGQSQRHQQPEGQDKKVPVKIVVDNVQLKGLTFLRETKSATTSIEIQERNRLLMPPPPDRPPIEEPLTEYEAEYFLEVVIQSYGETGMNPFHEESAIKELMDSIDLECSARCFRRMIRQSIELYEQRPWNVYNPHPLRDEIISDLKSCVSDGKGRVERDDSRQDMKAKGGKEEEENSPQHDTVEENKGQLVDVEIQEKYPERKQMMKKSSGKEHPYLNLLLNDMNSRIQFFGGLLDYRTDYGVFPFDNDYALVDFIRNWLEIDVLPGSLNGVIRFIRDEYKSMSITSIIETLRFWEPPVREAFDLANSIWGIYTEPAYSVHPITSGTKPIDDTSISEVGSENLSTADHSVVNSDGTSDVLGFDADEEQKEDTIPDAESKGPDIFDICASEAVKKEEDPDFDVIVTDQQARLVVEARKRFKKEIGVHGKTTFLRVKKNATTGVDTQEKNPPSDNTKTTTCTRPMHLGKRNIQEREDSDEEPLTTNMAQLYLEEVLDCYCSTGTNPLDVESALRDMISWLDCGYSVGQFRNLIKRSLEMHEKNPWDIPATQPLKDEKLLELKNSFLFTSKENVDRDASQQKKTESRDNKEVREEEEEEKK